jgi:hypothetical protein
MATAAYEDRLEINDPDECLTWYASSDRARRGFCKRCGSSLFFDPLTAPYIAIGLGSMAAPTELALQRHIFIEEKGDFYEIADEVAQYESMPNILPMPDRD